MVMIPGVGNVANPLDNESVQPSEKNSALAAVLSIVCVGAGQLYNGELTKAALLFGGAVVSGMLFGVGAWLLVVPLILYGAIDAHRTAEKFNGKVRQARQAKEDAEAAAAKLASETVAAHEFSAQIDKLYRLFKANLLDESEFTERKKSVLAELQTRRPREAPEDFLSVLVPLAKSEALNSDELKQIKALVL
ncbi:hypothetical protein [Burkholderia cenocepacia]|uniref:hypothetical protein n=1 Tax=Burkholderia cenocepacia TaxID=95486 RepID=UPI0015897C41|nr:hypothetical protein [Burkholderia cenocepacia]